MQDTEQEFSFKRLFSPLTTFKAIHIIVIAGLLVFGNTLFNNSVEDEKQESRLKKWCFHVIN
jgi:hypothetical protein